MEEDHFISIAYPRSIRVFIARRFPKYLASCSVNISSIDCVPGSTTGFYIRSSSYYEVSSSFFLQDHRCQPIGVLEGRREYPSYSQSGTVWEP